ncbi:MAG: ATP-grasp domain-containing protein, partial [Microcystaceae cyanobacterium]
MKTVLLVEPLSSGSQLITKGKELGFKVIVLTSNTDERIVRQEFLQAADVVEFVDTNNQQETLQKAIEVNEKFRIDGVLPGFEFYVPLAAKISAKLGLKGLNPESAENVRFKHLMRKVLEQENLRIPRFRVARSEDELLSAIDYVKFPCVIKPVDGAGSRNIKKVNNEQELQAAYKVIENTEFIGFGYKGIKEVLIEEYIAGNEYSIEGFVENGKPKFLSITEKLLSPEPHFVEVGHIVT